ncbi:radical SAM protein [Vibrio profundi]|uniref:radical SAM protein n=1 Tax=Vibrio profundi TaxID=1774960 RepID=UPI003737034A
MGNSTTGIGGSEHLSTYARFAAQVVGSIPAESLLEADDLAAFVSQKKRRGREVDLGITLNARKVVVVLKATRRCNLRCTYCNSWSDNPRNIMSMRTLITVIARILSVVNVTRFEFVWHGGEVTLLNPHFFKTLIWLQQQFRQPGQEITNALQTNAIDLSDEWLIFLNGAGVPVGISIDGYPAINDSRRIDLLGRGTSKRVEKGIQQLRDYSIPYGALVVVDRAVSQSDLNQLFDYFKRTRINAIEFLNIVPDNRVASGALNDPSYINYREYIQFLCEAFSLWYSGYKDSIRVNLFNEIMDKMAHEDAILSSCYWSGNCSQEVVTVEPNGEITPCDKFIADEGSQYGSLLEQNIDALLSHSEYNQRLRQEERDAYKSMQDCEWFSLCHGGCPHDRIINRRHDGSYQNQCCGTDQLFELISQTLRVA